LSPNDESESCGWGIALLALTSAASVGSLALSATKKFGSTV